MAEPSEWAGPGSLRGRCQGCGEIVEIDQDGYSHTRPEHDPACDGSCTIGCPVPVLCGPVTLLVPPADPGVRRVLDAASRLADSETLPDTSIEEVLERGLITEETAELQRAVAALRARATNPDQQESQESEPE